MSDHDLEQLVHELRTAIADSDSLADHDRARIDGLVERLETGIEDEHEGIVDHIEDSVHHFETDHPVLVETLNRIANALSAGGL